MEYDRTGLPEVYRAARALSRETLEVWGQAIRTMLPAGAVVERALDLGCGTARFTSLIGEALHASVLGVDPSLRMLAEREVRAGRFVAGTAEALPLADRTVDVVFASMVYHHLRPHAALPEVHRVLRPGGHLLIRNPTRESVGEFTYLAFFPEALAIDEARMPSRRDLIAACEAAGFALGGHERIRQRFAEDHADYFGKISRRALSALQLISDDAFARGLREFEAYCRSAERPGPIHEPVELFLFSRREPPHSGHGELGPGLHGPAAPADPVAVQETQGVGLGQPRVVQPPLRQMGHRASS